MVKAQVSGRDFQIEQVLAAVITARMGGNELFAVKKGQPVGIDFGGELLGGVQVGDRIAVALEMNAATVGGADRFDERTVVGHNGQGPESGLFFFEEFDGFAIESRRECGDWRCRPATGGPPDARRQRKGFANRPENSF